MDNYAYLKGAAVRKSSLFSGNSRTLLPCKQLRDIISGKIEIRQKSTKSQMAYKKSASRIRI